MKTLWSFILLLLVIVQATTIDYVYPGQAPGDEDERCLEDIVNEEDLMSSFNYRNLLTSGGGPWSVVNDDNNSDNLPLTISPFDPILTAYTWVQAAGAICERTVVVCGFNQYGPQDNWLITQFINNTMRQAVIYIRVRYAIKCEGGGSGCLTTLDTYVLQTNISAMSFSNVSNIFVTQPIATLTDTVRDGTTIVTRVLPVMADLSTTGLYVAFRDLGTCIALSEVTVFYPVCDAVLLDVGANFSVLGFPGDTSSGVCFTNMAISINPLENSFTATCTLTSMLMSLQQTDQLFTNWTYNGNALPQCMCLPGYEFTSRTTSLQCRACEPSHFKNTLSNTEMCKPCPMFSNTSEPAMEMCPCDDGYFRPSDGSEDAMNCTRPPSAPQNIAVSDVTNTSVIIMWEPPQDNGDRTDLFYSISHNVTDDVFNTTSTNMMLTGLIPFVYYELRVTADNGVSSQDNNTNARTVTISIMTEGACEPSHFKNTLSNTEMCKPCPLFSNTSEPAMEVCPCDDGYFRPSDGSEDAMHCTRPPSAPQSIAVSDVTNTSVIIMWEPPQDNGNRTDLFYSISHNVTDDVFNTTSTNMMLTGLIPFVYYELRVTADNGVSSQDNNTNARTVTISIMTEGGNISNSSSSGSSSSSVSSVNMGGVMGGVILLLIAGVVLFIVIMCIMRRSHGKEAEPHVYDEVPYNIIKLNTNGTNYETVDYFHRTIKEDLNAPITTNSYYSISSMSYSNGSEGEYDSVLPNEHYDAVKMDTDPSYGVSRVEDRAKVFSTTGAYYSTKAHQSSQQNNSTQMHHNTVTSTTGDVKENKVQLHSTHDTTHSHLIANGTKLTGQNNYGVINQPRCDDPSFDTIVDQRRTRKSNLPLSSKSVDENEYGIINQPQCNDRLPLTINTKLTGENKYGVVNQLQCDDPSINTIVDQNSDADEDGYGVINQPQCDDLM